MTDEEREAEQIEARMEASKDKPLTRADLISTFTQGQKTDIAKALG